MTVPRERRSEWRHMEVTLEQTKAWEHTDHHDRTSPARAERPGERHNHGSAVA